MQITSGVQSLTLSAPQAIQEEVIVEIKTLQQEKKEDSVEYTADMIKRCIESTEQLGRCPAPTPYPDRIILLP